MHFLGEELSFSFNFQRGPSSHKGQESLLISLLQFITHLVRMAHLKCKCKLSITCLKSFDGRKQYELLRTALQDPSHVEPQFLLHSYFLLFFSAMWQRILPAVTHPSHVSAYVALCLVGSSLFVCLATSNSSLRPNSKSLTLWHFPDTSLREVELITNNISATYILCTFTFAFTTLHCGILFISLSYLTTSTTEGTDHVNSFLYSQHLAECLILSKCMLDYK